MKTSLYLLCCFYSVATFSQKIALLDNKCKLPILFTDSVSVEQIRSGYYPIKTTDIDTFCGNLEYLISVLEVRQRAKMKSFELKAGTSSITTTRVPYAYGDRYSAIAKNTLNEVQTEMKLISSDLSNKDNAKHLKQMLAYVRKNKSLFREPYQITPKIYNVVVITD